MVAWLSPSRCGHLPLGVRSSLGSFSPPFLFFCGYRLLFLFDPPTISLPPHPHSLSLSLSPLLSRANLCCHVGFCRTICKRSFGVSICDLFLSLFVYLKENQFSIVCGVSCSELAVWRKCYRYVKITEAWLENV